MKNLFNNFMVNVLSMAHEDPPTGNGGSNNNSGTGTNTGGNNGTTEPEDLKNTTDNENTGGGNTGSGNNAGANSGGHLSDDNVLTPDVGVGVF